MNETTWANTSCEAPRLRRTSHSDLTLRRTLPQTHFYLIPCSKLANNCTTPSLFTSDTDLIPPLTSEFRTQDHLPSSCLTQATILILSTSSNTSTTSGPCRFCPRFLLIPSKTGQCRFYIIRSVVSIAILAIPSIFPSNQIPQDWGQWNRIARIRDCEQPRN